MEWVYVLVIILSVFLALFLLLGIILIVMLIKVTIQIKKVAETAQRTASGIEGFVSGVGRFSSPAMVAKTVFTQVKKFRKRKGDK